MKGREAEAKGQKAQAPVRAQDKFRGGRDWSGFDGFRAAHPTAPGGEEWDSFEAGLLAGKNLNAAQETIRYAILDRKAALGR